MRGKHATGGSSIKNSRQVSSARPAPLLDPFTYCHNQRSLDANPRGLSPANYKPPSH